ncbi:MAG: hypothetical protein IT537_12030 [Hyphomicrobiales bacterium]|nr:hypothetical protein [Hyphomicrobiales bacterium]
MTAAGYGISIDEFNADDYGPKALAWYTSGFTDRSHFETVEFSLWYYGPWFHMLTAAVQSLELGDRFAVRHAMTFLVGMGGLAALLPIGRLAVGRWAGSSAIVLCLLTGYLYGSLFFTPIDVPFLAAMTWAVLAILVMTRKVDPSWAATIVAGLTTGLAIATRTGGIILHVYLLGALGLCAVQVACERGALSGRYLARLAARYVVTLLVAWATAIALWPWLQVGNPLTQFQIALVHFSKLPMDFEFPHWGATVSTAALPSTYIPAQLAARLPTPFLLLLLVACLAGGWVALRWCRQGWAGLRASGLAGLRAPLQAFAQERALLVVAAAAVAPVLFLIVQHTTMYDAIRHVLFVIPMLAVLAAAGLRALHPWLLRMPVVSSLAAGLYAGHQVVHLALLHPLEYVSMNALAGGTAGASGRFELDYFTVAATEAVRRLERRLSYLDVADTPSILVCIPWRETVAQPLFGRTWRIETDPAKADFVVETERWRCADRSATQLIDEVTREGVAFAWTYAREARRRQPQLTGALAGALNGTWRGRRDRRE